MDGASFGDVQGAGFNSYLLYQAIPSLIGNPGDTTFRCVLDRCEASERVFAV